jgi:prepilin-type N-terminal cleavage/methylation domain-containing protein
MPLPTKNFPMHHQTAVNRGFTLIEIAVVLVILTILLATLAIPITTQLNQKRAAETQKMLDLAQQALIGYASANGRLPCPATDGVTVGAVNSFGDERFAVGGTATNGQCEYWTGYLPAVALGLSPLDSQGFMVDAWGLPQNRIRYAVWGSVPISINLIQYPFTKTGGIKAATTTALSDTTTPFLFVCQSAPLGTVPTAATNSPVGNACGGGVVKLTDKTPAVIYSLGANAATGGTGADEGFNVKTTATQTFAFVSHTPTVGGANEFDDMVSWISLNVLFNSMQGAGKLP